MGKAIQKTKKGVVAAAAGKKSKHKTKASNKVTSANATTATLGSGKDLGWQAIYTLNANQEATTAMQRGALAVKRGKRLSISSWDFDHLKDTVLALKQEHDNRDLYLFGCQPFPYASPFVSANGTYQVPLCPNIGIIFIESGVTPPSYVALQDFQQGKDTIKDFRAMGLTWEPIPGVDGVFALQSSRRPSPGKPEHHLEYTTLFTMNPSKEWIRKDDGSLDIEEAKFQYQYELDGKKVVVDEMYTKGESSFQDFCDRYDLDFDIHKPLVKEAVKKGFNKARSIIESRIKLLQSQSYTENILEEMFVVKVYPKNVDQNSRSQSYINKFYGHSTASF